MAGALRIRGRGGKGELSWVCKASRGGEDQITEGLLGGSEVKASASNAGNLGSIPGWGRSPGEENGKPLQYSCLENPMDRGAW